MAFFSLVGFSRRGLHIITTHKLLVGLILKVTKTNTHTHFYTCKDERAICLNKCIFKSEQLEAGVKVKEYHNTVNKKCVKLSNATIIILHYD